VLYALPVSVTVPLLLVVVAGIEEVAKSVHVYAGYTKRRFEPTVRSALVLGSLSGLGFFVGEKVTAVVQLVGLPDLTLGRAAFAPAGIGLSAGAGLLLLLAPLVLHAVTASVTALGARGGRTWYAGGLVAATAMHALYNLTVVVTLG
jgi:RsiW-degrading membrane proteinase PrsW (M82 family)